jgi:hypothetical protein
MMFRMHQGRASRSRRSESLENIGWREGSKRDGALTGGVGAVDQSRDADGRWREERDVGEGGDPVGAEEEREDEGGVRAGGSEEEEEEKPSEAAVWGEGARRRPRGIRERGGGMGKHERIGRGGRRTAPRPRGRRLVKGRGGHHS